MSKHLPLTQDEVDQYDLNPKIMSLIKEKMHLGDQKSIKILDWGAGKGRSLAKLRLMGFDAHGVEIDSLPYENGLTYFSAKHDHPKQFYQLIDGTCKTTFPDNYFDVIFSEQVFEHVKDLNAVIKEISRISKNNAVGFHQFPHKYHIVEQHLFMPFIHWLPKNLRYPLILLYVLLKIEPFWKELSNLNKLQKSKVYYKYSKDKTYYRSNRQIINLFKCHGFSSIVKSQLFSARINFITNIFSFADTIFIVKKVS